MNVSSSLDIIMIMISVAAVCEHGSIRLEGASSSSTGRVEVCINGTWGTVCSDFLDNNDASVICTQLGYSPYGRWLGVDYKLLLILQ